MKIKVPCSTSGKIYEIDSEVIPLPNPASALAVHAFDDPAAFVVLCLIAASDARPDTAEQRAAMKIIKNACRQYSEEKS